MRRPYWLLAAIVLIYLLAALVEPCDGDSCLDDTQQNSKE